MTLDFLHQYLARYECELQKTGYTNMPGITRACIQQWEQRIHDKQLPPNNFALFMKELTVKIPLQDVLPLIRSTEYAFWNEHIHPHIDIQELLLLPTAELMTILHACRVKDTSKYPTISLYKQEFTPLIHDIPYNSACWKEYPVWYWLLNGQTLKEDMYGQIFLENSEAFNVYHNTLLSLTAQQFIKAFNDSRIAAGSAELYLNHHFDALIRDHYFMIQQTTTPQLTLFMSVFAQKYNNIWGVDEETLSHVESLLYNAFKLKNKNIVSIFSQIGLSQDMVHMLDIKNSEDFNRALRAQKTEAEYHLV